MPQCKRDTAKSSQSKSKPRPGTPQQVLASLFDSERNSDKLHGQLIDLPHNAVTAAIRAAYEVALGLEDTEEEIRRLSCIARLAKDLTDPKAIVLLLELLEHEEDCIRDVAGSSIIEVSEERLAEIRDGITHAFTRHPESCFALYELPYIICEFDAAIEDRLDLLAPFLKHTDPDVVCPAIDACVKLISPAAIPMLQPLANDTRVFQASCCDCEDCDCEVCDCDDYASYNGDDGESASDHEDSACSHRTIGRRATAAIDALTLMGRTMESLTTKDEPNSAC